MINTIIFDLGGVILIHKATLIQEILHDLFPDSYNLAEKIWVNNRFLLQTGKITSADFILELKKNINTDLNLEELNDKWKKNYKKKANLLDRELLNFIEKLKRKFKIYLFTDTIDVHDEYNKTRNIYNKFNHVYKSFEEGVAKIEGKNAYLNLLKKIKTKPNNCIFIDDLELNIKNAKEVGIKGIVYKNLTQLIKKLKLNGVKI